jgi:spore coat polysaccharide biosynthesis protein SpsF (cytidylyltransferase family)/aryl-alcohol dehydrogenase-like predicted oxidoreductase
VLQARLSSSRLPGKALLPLGGMPIVELIARRASRTGYEVVVATSEETDDDPLAVTVAQAGLGVVRGSLDDVLGRFATATADLAPSDIVVRLTGDNPFVDADLIAELVGGLESSDHAYARIDIDKVPYGLGAEAFRVSALRLAAERATSSSDREHVTPWLRRELGESAVVPGETPSGSQALRCTIDVLTDYHRAFAVFAEVNNVVSVRWPTLVGVLQRLDGGMDAVPTRDTSELRQSVLVLGTAQLGMHYGVANIDGQPADARVRRMLQAAVNTGITHADTARAYGSSEATLRRCLEPALTRRLGFVTKVAPLTESVARDKDLVTLFVEASAERSFAELGQRRVDALLLHRAADATAADSAAWRRLLEYRREGAVARIGVSVQNPAELAAALELDGLGYVQLPFNVLDRRWVDNDEAVAADLLQERQDVLVSVRSLYLQGVLTGAGPAPRGIPVDVAKTRLTLATLAAELSRDSIADLCMAYVLAHPWVTSVVVGAETEAQVLENARLAARTPLSAEQCRELRRRLPAGAEDLINPSRWALS